MVVIDVLVTVTNNIKIYSMETCGFKTAMLRIPPLQTWSSGGQINLHFIIVYYLNTYTKVYVLNIIKEVIVCIVKIKM